MHSKRLAAVVAIWCLGTAAPCVIAAGAAQQPAQPFARPTLSRSVQTSVLPEKDVIIAAIENFFRAQDCRDSSALDASFHPDARGWAESNGEVGHEEWTRYVTWLRSAPRRPAPPSTLAESRTITDLVRSGNLAQAIVVRNLSPTSSAGTLFHYGLQLVRSQVGWTVVNLTYYSDRTEGHTEPRTLDAMGVKPGMTIAEIGAGTGRITVPLARRVDSSGKIYANDIDEKALSQLKERAGRLGLSHVETVVGTVDDPKLPKAAIDLAIMVWVFHHLDQPVALLKNLAPSLKPGARLVILDPDSDRSGERDSDRPSTRESVAKEASEAGFELVSVEAFLPRDNIFILRLKAPLSVAGR